MSAARFLVGDVFDRMAKLPDGSVDLIATSPPFLALRSYLPADHPDKHLEIGSEATPAAFLSTLLALTRVWRRLLAPHGSLCVELGDTYSGSGGAGGDYGPAGLREGQPRFRAGYLRDDGRKNGQAEATGEHAYPVANKAGPGWPLDKSLCLLPTLYPASLAYGRNMLDPDDQLEPWRIRNVIVWHRPNPPVGALGDKVRPSTSYVTVACTSRTRWFDLDAERTPGSRDAGHVPAQPEGATDPRNRGHGAYRGGDMQSNPAGAPPLDMWNIPTAPYSGSHYATFPPALPRKLINLMCPRQVCTICGEPRRRIVESERSIITEPRASNGARITGGVFGQQGATEYTTIGWSDCRCSPDYCTCTACVYADGDCSERAWRRGIVLDPFAGSGTTLMAASELGRDSIGIDLDHRNLDLARERLGMFLTEEEALE